MHIESFGPEIEMKLFDLGIISVEEVRKRLKIDVEELTKDNTHVKIKGDVVDKDLEQEVIGLIDYTDHHIIDGRILRYYFDGRKEDIGTWKFIDKDDTFRTIERKYHATPLDTVRGYQGDSVPSSEDEEWYNKQENVLPSTHPYYKGE